MLPKISKLLVAMLATLMVLNPPTVLAAPGDAPIGGEIFLDLDRDGEIDPAERVADSDPLFPPGGVAVNIYDVDGNSVAGTVSSSSSGVTWIADVTGLTGSNFRVEFVLDSADQAAGYSDTIAGPDSSTSVTFVSAGATNVSYGLLPPATCPTTSGEGSVWTTCFVNGDRTSGGPQDVVVGLDYDSTGLSTVGGKADLGSVWGLAYDEWTGTLYSSAFVKRLADLGPEGVDGLYWTDVSGSGTWSSVSLDALGGPSHGADLTNRNLGAFDDTTDTDFDTYGLVGKRGIGDIDLTPDGRTLLVSNIDSAAKSIDVYDVSAVGTGGSPSYVRSIAIPNPGCPDAVNTADFAIFAISAIDNATAYVGASCTGETTGLASDLEAHVVEIDITGVVAPASILSIPLDYERGCPAYSTNTTNCRDSDAGTATEGNFLSWSDDPGAYQIAGGGRSTFAFRPQAMFSDIEIDDDGSLVLGFADRFGHQMGFGVPDGTVNISSIAGEILRACNTSGSQDSPSWVVEGQPGCDGNFDDASGGLTNRHDYHSGPYGLTEFYGEERLEAGRGGHPETSNGGLYIRPGSGEVVVSIMDPLDVDSAGLSWFDNTTGAENNALQLYQGGASSGYFGKAAGIGDVEGCFAPIEIGNYVWLDVDQDGVQDPGELPLAGVMVTLTDSFGTVIATTTTDANGEYYFDTFDGVEPNTDYTISFDVSTNTTPLPGGFTNADLSETVPDASLSTDSTDSDVIGGEIDLTTGALGGNNYTYDAGFVLPEFFDLALQKQVSDGTNLAVVAPGDTVTFTITVLNQGTFEATDVVVTDYLPTSGLTLDDSDWTDNEDGTAEIAVPGTLAPGDSVDVDITFTVDADASGQINNFAEISSADDDGDPSNGLPVDIDSTPNDDPGDDNQPAGPNEATDDEVDEDGKSGGDEDDHDVAGIFVPPVYDLELIKTPASTTFDFSVSPPTVTFDLTVTNQGPNETHWIDVTDYGAPGLSYNGALTAAEWSTAGLTGVVDASPTFTIEGPLASGASIVVPVVYDMADFSLAPFTNAAEISAFDDDADQANTIPDYVMDIDSTPDAVNDDDVVDHDVQNYDPDDDSNLNEVTPGDEDDHDIETVAPYDLALAKTFVSADSPLVPSGTVTMLITVTNQAAPVETIDVTDYLDPAMWVGFDAGLNPGGSVDASSTASSAFTFAWDGSDPLNPVARIVPATAGDQLGFGETVAIPITVEVADPLDTSAPLLNIAEISNFDDDGDPSNGDASNGSLIDLDSTPDDTDESNAAETIGGDLVDDAINDPNDEDDHDPVTIPILDLALRKTLAPSTAVPVAPGSQVTFSIEVFNQGSTHASGIGVIDYVDLAMWEPFDAALNPAGNGYSWSTVGTNGAVTIADTLAPGDSIVVPVTLLVGSDADLEALANTAEISAATASTEAGVEITNPDGSTVADIDSVPDTDNTDLLTDDVIDGSFSDEDDHDIAYVTPPTYSLGNQVWNDADNNGTLDQGEALIEGVVVHLFVDTDGDGAPDDRNGDGVIDDNDAVATDTTGSDGEYLFTDLSVGDYIVGIAPQNWDDGGVLDGWLSSDPTSTNPNDDVDDNDDGTPDQASGYVLSGSVTLNDGEPIGEPGLDNDTNNPDALSNLTVDFGFWQPRLDLALEKTVSVEQNTSNLMIGDDVTYTIEVFNQGTVDATNITLVDYIPTELELNDSDWALGTDGTASIALTGVIIAPGQSTTVDVTMTILTAGEIDNHAEVSNSVALGVLGAVLTEPDGTPIADFDSTADADNSDMLIDGLTNTNAAGGDEDDHDIASIAVAEQVLPPLAFTGLESRMLATWAILLAGVGLAMVTLVRRRGEVDA